MKICEYKFPIIRKLDLTLASTNRYKTNRGIWLSCCQVNEVLGFTSSGRKCRAAMCKKMYDTVSKLTYSMVQSPSWEANWFVTSQEIPRISRNPKVHYRTHNRPPTVSILGQPNPVHIPTSHLLEIHPILSTHLRLRLPSGCLQRNYPACECFGTSLFYREGC